MPATGVGRWVTLRPLPEGSYDVSTRARDLVLRMLAAKVGNKESVFCGDPFDSSRGLLEPDGTPCDMLLPWCITAGMIGGAEYLGSIRLVEGSQNYVFRRDGEAVMVVWNPTPVVETVYLGENVQQLDLWGRVQQELDPQQKPGQKQQIAVGAMPTFITGVNLPLAQWRMACAFEPAMS